MRDGLSWVIKFYKINQMKEEAKVLQSCPTGMYMGTGEVEGYSIVMLPEQDTVNYRRKDALESAGRTATHNALMRAYEVAKDKAPNCGDCIPTISIVLSSSMEEKPYTEATPIAGLPHAAQHMIPKVAPGTKYRIIVVSVTWTARWVCLPTEGIEFAPNDGVVPSGQKIYIGNQAFDFGAPQPSRHNTVSMQSKYDQADQSRIKEETFLSRADEQIRAMGPQVMAKMWAELENAILHLPKCPPECNNSDMSITIGYPKPFLISYKKRVKKIDTPGYEMVDGNYQQVTKLVDSTSFEILGEWSWSVQRNCVANDNKKKKADAS